MCMWGNCRSQRLEFAAWELAPRKGVCGVVVLRSGGCAWGSAACSRDEEPSRCRGPMGWGMLSQGCCFLGLFVVGAAWLRPDKVAGEPLS